MNKRAKIMVSEGIKQVTIPDVTLGRHLQTGSPQLMGGEYTNSMAICGTRANGTRI